MKSIAFITRVHPARPSMLKICVDSVHSQTSDDYLHILHRGDPTPSGCGVPLANQSLSRIRAIDARYSMILDDDDMLTDPDFVRVFAETTKDQNYEIVFFKGVIKSLGVFPKIATWGKRPLCGSIASFCFAVRTDIWLKEIHTFLQKTAGDYSFIASCYDHTKNHFWLDRIVAETQKKPGRGRGEKDHA